MYLVIQCYECGRFLLATIEQKTRRCPYCGRKLQVRKVKTLARARNARLASSIIKQLKELKS